MYTGIIYGFRGSYQIFFYLYIIFPYTRVHIIYPRSVPDAWGSNGFLHTTGGALGVLTEMGRGLRAESLTRVLIRQRWLDIADIWSYDRHRPIVRAVDFQK